MWSSGQPTKTIRTQQNYLSRYESWQKILALKYKVPAHKIPTSLVAEFVIELSRKRRKSTWRQYRAAVISYMEAHKIVDTRAMELLDQESLRRQFGDRPDEQKQEQRTSSDKAKGLGYNSRSVMNYRLGDLLSNASDHDLRMIVLVGVIQLIGVRPIELFNIKLDCDEIGRLRSIVISNAKESNGRGNGAFRTLHLSGCSDDELQMIGMVVGHADQLLADVISKNAQLTKEECLEISSIRIRKEFKAWFLRRVAEWVRSCDWPEVSDRLSINNSRSTKARVVDELSRVTLYTFRHQFFANAKAAMKIGYVKSAVDIAACGGHSSTRTHQLHYAKQVKGIAAGFKVEPSVDSIGRVKPEKSRVVADFSRGAVKGDEMDADSNV